MAVIFGCSTVPGLSGIAIWSTLLRTGEEAALEPREVKGLPLSPTAVEEHRLYLRNAVCFVPRCVDFLRPVHPLETEENYTDFAL